MENAATNTPDVVDAAQMLLIERQTISARRRGAGVPDERPCFGIGISGGGIRSGTFNLGILQGIARAGLLPCVDYLSTVSGGGYIGTWLHALIKRHGAGNPGNITEELERPDVRPHAERRDPISFLRTFSSYLAPDVGLFSADTWVIAVIWFRNMLLNQLILVPFLACLSLLVFLLACWSHSYAGGVHIVPALVELLIAAVLFAIAIRLSGGGAGATALPEKCDDAVKPPDPPASDSVRSAVGCAVLILIAGFLLASASQGLKSQTWLSEWKWWPLVPALGGICTGFGFLYLQTRGKFSQCYRARHDKREPSLWLYVCLFLIPGEATAFLFFGIATLASRWNPPQAVAWATPLFVLAAVIGEAIHIGLMGIDYPDSSREWLARAGAFMSIFAAAWAALFVLGVFGVLWISQLAVWSARTVGALGAGWVLTSVGGALAGSSTKTGGPPGEPQGPALLRFLSAIAPSAFVAGLLLLISFGLHRGIVALCGIPETAAQTKSVVANSVDLHAHVEGNATAHFDLKGGTGGTAPPWMQTIVDSEAALIENYPSDCLWPVWFLAIGTVIVWLLPRRININEFSMHHFYKNRLVRCYLGATRKERAPSRVTGFDSCDDIPLSHFLPTDAHPYYGPFPIINTCLNLNTGSELAKRERKGTSFVFTPLYSGFVPPRTDEDDRAVKEHDRTKPGSWTEKLTMEKPHYGGFRKTINYGYPGTGPDIGSCMAISGAAANPNAGFNTSAPLAFLMTIFNVRLGWWVGNPRLDGPSREPGPRHALVALLSELFAQTDARSNFLNLSDGGHFENLGLYELVRRRCRYIIIGDGEQDGLYTFESLGGAVRKCRADFGVDIDIDPRRIHPATMGGLSGTHCVVGQIRYPATATDPASEGWLLYLKASLTGDEPEDVAQYKSSHLDFPQEPTSNQFFTESQFESYRKLGLHVWESAVQNLNPNAFDCSTLDQFFECLYRTWYPPTEIPAGAASKQAEVYSELLNKLSDPALAHLTDQVISPAGPAHVPAEPRVAENPGRDFLYALELIQLMENVWSDLRMSEKSNRESPANRGWITVFLHWTHQPLFRSAWQRASYTFNPIFQQFYETLAASYVGGSPKNMCGPLPWDLGKVCIEEKADKEDSVGQVGNPPSAG